MSEVFNGFKFVAPKSGGANESGDVGGIYVNDNADKFLLKKDIMVIGLILLKYLHISFLM
jgi:hypothetical protein